MRTPIEMGVIQGEVGRANRQLRDERFKPWEVYIASAYDTRSREHATAFVIACISTNCNSSLPGAGVSLSLLQVPLSKWHIDIVMKVYTGEGPKRVFNMDYGAHLHFTLTARGTTSNPTWRVRLCVLDSFFQSLDRFGGNRS